TIDPSDFEQYIQDDYYPVLMPNSAQEVVKIAETDQTVMFKIYYPGAAASNHPSRVIFQFFDSENSLIGAIVKEEIDFAITESYSTAEEVHKSTTAYAIHFRYKRPNEVKTLVFNNQHNILRSAVIRQALTYLIDRHAILERVLNRTADLADGPLSRESSLHLSDLEEYKFNPKKAIQLLQSENWFDTDGDDILDKAGVPFRITLGYEKGVAIEEQLATRIKLAWNKMGIDVLRKPMFKSEIKKSLMEKNYDVLLTTLIFDETIESIETYFGSRNSDNIFGYRNRKIDHLFSLYHIQPDQNSRKLLLQAILKQINSDQPGAFLFFLWLDRYFVNRQKFTNFQSKGKLLPFAEWEFRK
ncbi:MAG: ABC transporter substrate-binding protein, partial [candidate division KSB1 bacterium]|nr:ABC transporter substrate-binding protein [candidate division KSB1 bacterium]